VKCITIAEAIDELEEKFPGIKIKILSDSNQIYNYITIFLGNEDIKYLKGLKTKLQPSDQITILVAVAGG
ncbi:MAG: MoaD/ThiS family protein, partial [Bacteriovorax sp.]|nr:MoaD/ThiS family protein [Bacteriovorax sp.]